MMAVLSRRPLKYRRPKGGKGGSHTKLKSEAGYPDIPWWAHDKEQLRPSVVKAILVESVGLSEAEARKLV
jgi:hypothetical protein